MKQFAIYLTIFISIHHANIASFNGDHYQRMQTNTVSEDGMGQFIIFSGLKKHLCTIEYLLPFPSALNSIQIISLHYAMVKLQYINREHTFA